MQNWRKRSAVARSLAVFSIIVVVGGGLGLLGVGYSLSTRQVGQIPASGGMPAVISGMLSVPTGSGNGTLTVNLRNEASSPITSATFAGTGPDSISNVSSLALMYQDRPLSTSNPLPVGDTACNSVQVENITAGDTYAFEATTSFQNGSNLQTVSMTAQIAQGSCTSANSQTATQSSSTCSSATPLSLTQEGPVIGHNFGNLSFVALSLTWWNCSDRTLDFTLSVSPVTVTMSINGTTSEVPATLDTGVLNSSDTAMGPNSGTGIELPVVFNTPLNPAATVLQINCTVTAIDPITGQPLSMPIVVNTSDSSS